MPEISVTDDFFLDLGGHSLLASQSVSLVRAALSGVPISVRDFYEHRTVRQLAAILLSRKGNQSHNANDAVDAKVSEAAFKRVHPLMRWTVAGLQALSVAVYYSILAAPLAFVVIMATAVIDGAISWPRAATILTIVGFAVWPSMLLFSIAIKWLVIGRLKPGRYPLWSFYYFRWWLVTRFQALSWAEMFSGTPLMNLYWRAMGAKIGRNVVLSNALCGAFDVVSIGEGSSIGLESQLLGYRVEDGYLVIAPIEIGDNCFVGMHCSLGLDTKMGDGARLDDMSLLPDGTVMMKWRRPTWIAGAPGRCCRSRGHVGAPAGRVRTFLFGALHLALIYVMGYFLIATIVPSVAIIVAGLWFYGPMGGVAGAFIAVPVGILTYVGSTILLVRLLPPS